MCNATCIVEKSLWPWLSSFFSELVKKGMFFPQSVSRLPGEDERSDPDRRGPHRHSRAVVKWWCFLKLLQQKRTDLTVATILVWGIYFGSISPTGRAGWEECACFRTQLRICFAKAGNSMTKETCKGRGKSLQKMAGFIQQLLEDHIKIGTNLRKKLHTDGSSQIFRAW